MNIRIRGMIGPALAVMALTSAVWAQQQVSDEERLRKMVENEQAAAAPAQEHKLLAGMVGKWDMEVKFWPGPGAAPIVMKGACDNKMILGGRFLKSESTGTGSPIETLQIMGFDRRFGKYTYVGYDNFGTYYVTAEGAFDKGKNSLTLQGEEQDPGQNRSQKYDIVFRFISPTKYVSEVIFKSQATSGPSEFKVAEVTFTQSK